jgi:hypothetical protein
MEPDAMAVVAMKRGKTEMKKNFPKCAIFKHHQRVSMPLERPFVYVFKFPFHTNFHGQNHFGLD